MHKIYKSLLLAIFLAFSFQGCLAKFFTIGEQQTFQEINGKQYKNCGSDSSFVDLLEDTDAHSKNAYKNCIIVKEKGWFDDEIKTNEDEDIKETYIQRKYNGMGN